MRNIESFNKPAKETSEIQEAKVVEEIEIFRAIAQEYFIDDSNEEVDTIPWDLSTKEKLTTSVMAQEINFQNLLIELVMEARIEITWAEDNKYQDTYLIDIPRWGEAADELEFEENIFTSENYDSYPHFNEN
ncbi:622_t:CDS:2 [Dentiscutata erythropus]|uniref:622_t:CDS:1 n=1 Tax=Dentiscutata erythropus TaxID=1348616 RepID=A0A9N9FH51_9GLOM|nr:622_t:CDS:2 [Dentiscutata erythropus]